MLRRMLVKKRELPILKGDCKGSPAIGFQKGSNFERRLQRITSKLASKRAAKQMKATNFQSRVPC
jgi:hypothetical protein